MRAPITNEIVFTSFRKPVIDEIEVEIGTNK